MTQTYKHILAPAIIALASACTPRETPPPQTLVTYTEAQTIPSLKINVGPNFNIVVPENNLIRVFQSFGGSPEAHKLEALKAKLLKTTIRFEGPCASACTILALSTGPTACKTPQAKFYIHAHYNKHNGTRMLNEHEFYPPAFLTWVASRGGFPVTNDLAQMLEIPTSVINPYVKDCT